MSEEQLKAADAEAVKEAEDVIEEISEDDLEGVAGGGRIKRKLKKLNEQDELEEGQGIKG